ncbi:metallophosphoesterase [Naumannella halotolerans]|uniref:3',5'-cyclic AMP phosphodiesterase CpdA n=1 Tax=Naumannella halotolerans TaxID=993414 RepID=A0A4R7J749_9ACTN|nr:metallophosphoesterase [Naumannella halotolerans]TDT33250.1 3',5'-cyclic AMP phosphodiesterase CpdA [Naumannella halotolerans]
MPLIAQVSDTHFDNTAETARRNAVVWDYLDSAALPIELVLLTGDVAADGRPEEYAEALARVSGSRRVIAIPGNHDLRSSFATGLPGISAADPSGPLDQVVTVDGVRVIALDSTIPGSPRNDAGHLSEQSLTFLDAALTSRTGESALIALHHPPVTLGHPVMDPIRLDNAEALAEVLSAHDRLAGIVCGHAHAAAATTFATVPLVIAPGVTSTFTLGFTEAAEGMQNRDLPPGLALHRITDGVLLTEFRHLIP